ncbi:hypothetical protein CA3LBN_004573 [Candidozyma haemuli]|uniref:Tr-type G domain-containing protein n=1 Tax=Candidozyma haemuli TaxID=45357 RepID=A0ABX8IAX9_9ASCO|nr:hypothetical protein CA3LBN_004573 [[Candida] haemuloni]
MKLSPEKVRDLQSSTANVRNICILAHVDHGKTSLSDSLLATNGIISQRMAGKVRYLDSREDEQLRGITMESSAISLYFRVMRKKEGSEEAEVKEHLINLIDSPGHIDFSSEVSTASRLCDGAVVLVDVVEGVCSQTVNVLRQCWVDRLKPLLVLNKMDRLITELQFSPLEAYQHLSRLVEQVNSVIGSFYAGDRMEDDMKWREAGAEGEFVEKSDSDLYFSPENNNVIFASAVDGWAFSINTFARIYSAKLGFSHAALSKTLWGDFYLDMKNKKVIPGSKLKPSQSSLKPLFVSLVLEQIWNIYDACVLNRDDEKLEKITSKLGSKLSPRDLRSTDYKALLNSIMSQWIPLSHALLGAVIEYLPNPSVAQESRMEKILDECIYSAVPETTKEQLLDAGFKKALEACDSNSADSHTLAYISKMLSIPNAELPKEATIVPSAEELQERSRKAREIAKKASDAAAALADARLEQEDGGEIYLETKPDQFQWEFEEDPDEEEETEVEKETLIAFTRVYSGKLSRGQRVCVVGPKYDPALGKNHPSNIEQLREDVEIQDLLLIMGREFVRVDSVPAGNIVGLVGLGDLVLKNATIMSEVPEEKPYLNFASTATLIHNKPIMRVAIEPDNLLKLYKLEKGLELLTKADPVLEWYIDDDSGELIVCVAGELHLERCLKDLETRFAPGCEVVIKEPVIPFREGLNADAKPSITKEELENDSEAEEEEVEEDEVDLQIDVFPLPDEVTSFLTKSELEIKELVNSRLSNNPEDFEKHVTSFHEKIVAVLEQHPLPREVLDIFKSVTAFVDNIISFGPKRVGANVFVEAPSNGQQFRRVLAKENEEAKRFEFESNVLGGFQLAMHEGPLCSEPIQGTIVVLQKSYRPDTEEVLLNLAGRILKQTKQLIHKGFLLNAPRLFLAMYTCEIQTSPEVLGKVYVVIQKRGGSIISEEMKEGTPFFTINARIPVVEAFGFSEEIRKRTSGAASPQLVFDGFDMLDIDPFWVPHTEEELEELGTFAERENVARRYMNNIRRRKGLFVDEKVVQNAEKQRTLKKD